MEENKKKQRRVSFASEAPEQNVYEKEITMNSFTTDDITADFTCEQTKIGKSFYSNIENQQTKKDEKLKKEEKKDENLVDEEKENDSVMSNNTAVFDELVNTQYIRTIVPPQKPVQININELLMEQGIRFLDDIVLSSTRRETLSKSKKEVDPKNIIYYKNYLSHRIKFFEDFSEDLKNELGKLSEDLRQVEINFEIKNTLLEKEDKSKLRSLKSDCRNRATVSWYELRAKKELEFNDQIIKIKNDLINEFMQKEILLENIKKQNTNVNEDIKKVTEKLELLNSHEILNITNSSLDKLQQDISNHEQVLEDYLLEYEKLKIDLNNKKINENVKEVKFMELKNEIQELETQFRSVSVNENDLNDVKNEYEKFTAILGLETLELKNDNLKITFMDYEILLVNQILEDIKFVGMKSIIHEYGLILCKKSNLPFLELLKLLNIIHEVYKEILYIRNNYSVDIFIENEELKIVIFIKDLVEFRNYKVCVSINTNFEVVVEKEGDIHEYTLYKDKGCIMRHI